MSSGGWVIGDPVPVGRKRTASNEQPWIGTEHGSFYLSQHDDGAVQPLRFSIGTKPRGEGHGAALVQEYLTAARETFPEATTARVFPFEGMLERFWGRNGFTLVDSDGPLGGVIMEHPL